MDYTNLGRSGLKVSRLCLGTMNFGPQTTEADSFKIMDRAHEHGINFFDTANVYGWKKGEGVTEQILGRWFAQGGGRREKTVLATKLYGGMGDWPNTNGLSALHIRKACDESLLRMKTDYIDLYQMHHISREVPWDEIWGAMERLVQDGKVIYVGSSNFAGWHIAKANEAARRRNFFGLVSEQSLYNLLDRMIELEVVPTLDDYGLGLIPWSPLAGGILGGAFKKMAEGRRMSESAQKRVNENKDKLEKWEKLCSNAGQQAADMALAWLLSKKRVTAPIIGPRTTEQLDGALKALEIKISSEENGKIDEIFPGYKTAPEHYAW